MNDKTKSRIWYTSKAMAKICNIHKRTIERKRIELMKKKQNLDWFKTDTKPFKYKYDLIGEFNPKILELIRVNHKLDMRIKQLSNTINNLPDTYGYKHHPERAITLEQYLYLFQWDYFITIAYKDSLPQMECFSLMHELYHRIEESAPEGTSRMYFTTEPFTNRTGHHNHFLLRSDLEQSEIENLINEHTPSGRTDIKPYNKELAAIFYINKEGSKKEHPWSQPSNIRKEEGWDILGNNLAEESKLLINAQAMQTLNILR